MITKGSNHKHTYDAEGRMTCCTQEEKIYSNAGASSLLKEVYTEQNGHNHDDGHRHIHEAGDGHEHSGTIQSTLQMFLPAVFSFVLLLTAITFDNWIEQTWFSGWVRLMW